MIASPENEEPEFFYYKQKDAEPGFWHALGWLIMILCFVCAFMLIVVGVLSLLPI